MLFSPPTLFLSGPFCRGSCCVLWVVFPPLCEVWFGFWIVTVSVPDCCFRYCFWSGFLMLFLFLLFFFSVSFCWGSCCVLFPVLVCAVPPFGPLDVKVPDCGSPCYSVSFPDCVPCVCFLVRASPFPCSWLGVLVALIPVVVWVVLVFHGPCCLWWLLVWVFFLCMSHRSDLSSDMSSYPAFLSCDMWSFPCLAFSWC